MKKAKVYLRALKETKGRIFCTVFVKKNGSLRTMVARTGVHKGVNGTGMSYDPESKGLIPVYDMQKKAWRMVNVNTMKSLKCGEIEVNEIDFCNVVTT